MGSFMSNEVVVKNGEDLLNSVITNTNNIFKNNYLDDLINNSYNKEDVEIAELSLVNVLTRLEQNDNCVSYAMQRRKLAYQFIEQLSKYIKAGILTSNSDGLYCAIYSKNKYNPTTKQWEENENAKLNLSLMYPTKQKILADKGFLMGRTLIVCEGDFIKYQIVNNKVILNYDRGDDTIYTQTTPTSPDEIKRVYNKLVDEKIKYIYVEYTNLNTKKEDVIPIDKNQIKNSLAKTLEEKGYGANKKLGAKAISSGIVGIMRIIAIHRTYDFLINNDIDYEDYIYTSSYFANEENNEKIEESNNNDNKRVGTMQEYMEKVKQRMEEEKQQKNEQTNIKDCKDVSLNKEDCNEKEIEKKKIETIEEMNKILEDIEKCSSKGEAIEYSKSLLICYDLNQQQKNMMKNTIYNKFSKKEDKRIPVVSQGNAQSLETSGSGD